MNQHLFLGCFFRKSILVWIPFFLLGVNTCVQSLEYTKGFVAEGSVSCRFFLNDGSISSDVRLSSTDNYRIAVAADGRWMMTIWPKQSTNDVVIGSFDGTNTYAVYFNHDDPTVRDHSHSNSRGSDSNGPSLSVKLHNAFVAPGPFPSYLEYNPRMVWLTFCSFPYFESLKTNVMGLPWLNEKFELLAYGFRFEADFLDEKPHSPKNIAFIRAVGLDLLDENEIERPDLEYTREKALRETRLQHVWARKKLWPDGFHAGIFSTHDFASYGGYSLPHRSECKTYYPLKTNEPNRIFTCSITNVFPLTEITAFQPPVRDLLGVLDARFVKADRQRVVDHINYELREGESWRSMDDPTLQTGFSSVFAQAKRFSPTKQRLVKYSLVVACLVFAFILPLLLLKRNCGVGQNSNKSSPVGSDTTL